MTYSVIGILAILIHLIINHDIIRKKKQNMEVWEQRYRWFLYVVIAYHVTDALWGILYERKLIAAVYLDTTAYFATMAFSVLLWTMFVVTYLEGEGRFKEIISMAGWVFFLFQMLVVVINFIMPVLFSFDENGTYHAWFLRYALFTAQVLMFLMTSGYTMVITKGSQGTTHRRNLMICLFGVAMISAICLQLFFPLLPLYSIGYLLGGCVIHTFVVEGEKVEYLRALEESLGREALQEKQLGAYRKMAYTDPLTGVKSKRAFKDNSEAYDRRIREGFLEFAVGVFDLNDLKKINDIRGHEAGDESIIAACRLVCKIFAHSPVYRVGGDEFVAIIEGTDYENRHNLMREFQTQVDENAKEGKVIVAGGLSDYDPVKDATIADVFRRADENMYARKSELKQKNPVAV
ncbi:MAG: GGDEF domain-containing protein [Lachnospiraceae bacterium]|nr:GGDEF domain-containing protein [Lachnospiraceae bacterium]